MNDLWKIIAALSSMNLIVRYKTWPKGPYTFAVYDNSNENDNKSWLYDAKTESDLEKQVMVDWGHLVESEEEILQACWNGGKIPKPTGMPLPPGLA